MLCDAQYPTARCFSQNPSFPYCNVWNGQYDILLSASNQYRNSLHHHPFLEAILSRIALHREEVILRLSLYCRRDIRLGISTLYSCNFANNNDSLSIPTASDVMFNATISRSENLGTTPLLGTFPDSLTKLPAICLHMFSNFANIAYRLCIRYLSIKSLITFNLLNINNMHNFLYINLL